jgi:hypothetical protein
MSSLHFALTALGTLCFTVWANITFTDQHPYYWIAIFSSPVVIMFALVLITKTISGFFGLFAK